MKKKYFILFTLFAVNTAFGQVTFNTLTSNTTQDLEAIDIRQITNNTFELWTVGTGGVILQSSDNGVTWTAQTSGVTATLTDVDFVTSSDGWACGSSGTILATQDAGATWGIQAQGAPVTLNTTYFHSISSGIVMGDQAYTQTSTGGSSWNPTTTDFTANSVDFISSSFGIACSGSGFIYKTLDGGATWNYFYTGTPAFLEDIQFVSATEGWISGYSGSILHTIDAGVTWTLQPTGLASSISGIKFFDSENGWACGYGGVIYHTVNGGDTWTAHTGGFTGTLLYLKDLVLFSATEGIAVGEDGTIIHFEDNTNYASMDEATLSCSVVPNPSSQQVIISVSQPTNLSIQNLAGQIILETSVTSQLDLDISTFSSGVYFVKTADGQTVKLIKE